MGITRQFLACSSSGSQDAKSKPVTLRLMTFNVLAQGLSGNSFIKCPLEALTLEKRLVGIVEEIKEFSADIICLQEVDMYTPLKEQLPAGYEGFWMEKASSPCLLTPDNIGPDGSAVLWKSDTVELISKQSMPLEADGSLCSQIMVACHFRLKSGHTLLVVCLHLKAKKPFAELRKKQCEFVLKFIESNSDGCDSVIIAGDLNSVPTEPGHALIMSTGFVSSYVSVTGQHSVFTTSKIRSIKGVETLQQETEDYIYCKNMPGKKELTVDKVLEIPAESTLGEGHLPNLDYPSDHLSMVTDFTVC